MPPPHSHPPVPNPSLHCFPARPLQCCPHQVHPHRHVGPLARTPAVASLLRRPAARPGLLLPGAGQVHPTEHGPATAALRSRPLRQRARVLQTRRLRAARGQWQAARRLRGRPVSRGGAGGGRGPAGRVWTQRQVLSGLMRTAVWFDSWLFVWVFTRVRVFIVEDYWKCRWKRFLQYLKVK